MTLTPKSFLYAVSDGVASITLNRPDRINALTFEVYRELRDTFRALSEEREVRVVVLSGEGPRGFCSGGDVRDIIGELFARDTAGLLEFTRLTGSLVHAIRTTRPPVIAALHGVVAGAGAVIATACDVRFAAPDARIAFLFPQVGLSGADMGAAYLLPRIVGLGRATEILLSGDFVPAEEAARIGLFNRVVSSGSVRDEALAFAHKLARGPAFAHAMTKRMLEYEGHVDFGTGIEAEAQAQAICMQHPDFREAYDAWVEKRAPRFK
ncbi:MAG: enoyl-CoA hydratase family protein [Kofleriaceae bacterium]|nr:enoyl-CoA hydratase family protein [Kofleriaceae bacterium]